MAYSALDKQINQITSFQDALQFEIGKFCNTTPESFNIANNESIIYEKIHLLPLSYLYINL